MSLPSPHSGEDCDVIRSTLSPFPTSGFTQHVADDVPSDDTLQSSLLRVIGRGTCGTIFSRIHSNDAIALKVGRDTQALENDVCLTDKVYSACLDAQRLLQKLFDKDIKIPRVPITCGFLDGLDSEWCEMHGVRLTDENEEAEDEEETHDEEELEEDENESEDEEENEDERTNLSKPTSIFALTRIPSISPSAYQALRRHYTPSHPPTDNGVCLIRPYLGLPNRDTLGQPENLWNLPMTLADFLQCGITWPEIFHIAQEMALGLATVHWGAGIDGMDMEFVLGGEQGWKPEGVYAPNVQVASKIESSAEHTRTSSPPLQTHLYILDFDKAQALPRPLSPNRTIQALFVAITCNDPYFPDPAAERGMEKQLWDVFKAAYLKAAHELIRRDRVAWGHDGLEWPGTVLEKWETWARERREEGDGIEFG
ncbi:hypothetical protein BDV95DRAFT_600206 [Massariosphaeria phaeospora]|uniref:DUF3669 domain-containing protein n=1 Tax=Massariosphaeria phaeospora TaxID=100035 RepID=A0A7C8M147_9PLEO|nr:hypothetical protein BDV95DRAFT_600206 [Massariosphaeria phaeospora]